MNPLEIKKKFFQKDNANIKDYISQYRETINNSISARKNNAIPSTMIPKSRKHNQSIYKGNKRLLLDFLNESMCEINNNASSVDVNLDSARLVDKSIEDIDPLTNQWEANRVTINAVDSIDTTKKNNRFNSLNPQKLITSPPQVMPLVFKAPQTYQKRRNISNKNEPLLNSQKFY